MGESTCVEGECTGSLNYIENTGTATAPVFVQRTGSANPFDAINVGWSSVQGIGDRGTNSRPAFADLDGDGTLRLRPSINKLRPHVTFLAQATWTS